MSTEPSQFGEETNPIARQMMRRFGQTKVIRMVFIVSLIIITIAGAATIAGDNNMKALFIVIGLAISIVQGAVAYLNWSDRENVIT
jgi:quinol-cytochrome oxidoreductase complex cytochrome b subunit